MSQQVKPNQRVLLVDDEPFVIEMLAAELSERGIDYLSAPDGNTALQIIESEKPSVVVTDHTMPGLNGIELIRFLRNIGIATPVIWITGNAAIETKREAWKLGVYHLFQKPFDPREVARNIQEVLAMDPEEWLRFRPDFLTESYIDKHFQKLQIELEKGFYLKVKERCLKDCVSINSFISSALRDALK